MKNFMNYDEPIPALLLGLFRHKMVHLAMPKTVFEYTDNASAKHQVKWNYTHNTPEKHLLLEGVIGQAKLDGGLWMLPFDQVFWLDIRSFTNEIINSAIGAGGYLERLPGDTVLQEKYAVALNGLYDSTK